MKIISIPQPDGKIVTIPSIILSDMIFKDEYDPNNKLNIISCIGFATIHNNNCEVYYISAVTRKRSLRIFTNLDDVWLHNKVDDSINDDFDIEDKSMIKDCCYHFSKDIIGKNII